MNPATEGPEYGFTARFPGLSMEESRKRVAEALAEQGFGILTEIDAAATLKQKIGVDMGPYLILGACNPKLAHRALTADPFVGLLLPCNVCLWKEADATVISIANPRSLFQVVDQPSLAPVAAEATERLRAVHAKLRDWAKR